MKQSEQQDLSQFSPLLKSKENLIHITLRLSLASLIHHRIMDLRKAPRGGGLGGGSASFAQMTMINNNKATNNDSSLLLEEDDDLKGVRHFLRLSDKDEDDEEDNKDKEKAAQPDDENENEKDARRFRRRRKGGGKEDKEEEDDKERMNVSKKEKEEKIPMNRPAKHSSKFEKLQSTTCVFAEDDTCLKALKCKELGVPLSYTYSKTNKKRRLSYRVPENYPKFAGRRCCGTCYYKCAARETICAFAKDGTCAVANKREKDGMKVAFNYLKYRVPSNHEKYPGMWCCNSCYYKIQAKGKLCAFAKEGTCLIAKEKEEKGLVLEYSILPQRVPKTHPKYAGERCCETCYNRCLVKGKVCAFLASGECAYAKKLGVAGKGGSTNKNKNENKRARGENQNGQQEQEPELEYKRFHRVPNDHPKFAGKLCCNPCYIAFKAEGQKCAFMDEGKCSYAKNVRNHGIAEVVYKNLTYRVPASHDTHAGERCCRTCYRKCSEHAKEVRWATVLSNLLEKN